MNRRIPGNSGRETGRTAAAHQLLEHLLGGEEPARDWSQAIELPAERDRDLDEMLRTSGSVSALARDLNVSRSTVQRWKKGSAPTSASQDKITAYNRAADKRDRAAVAQRELGELVDRYGGTQALARHLDTTASTVRRWMRGETKTIPAAQQQRLAKADRQYRFRRTTGVDMDATGTPARPVYVRARGGVHVHTASSPPYGVRSKNIGSHTPGGPGHPLDDDVIGGLYDLAGDGDAFGALDVLQGDMSINYAQVPEGYDPDQGYGMYFDDLETFDLLQDDL